MIKKIEVCSMDGHRVWKGIEGNVQSGVGR